MRKGLDVVLFGRKGCHLCEAVEEEVRSKGATIRLSVVDIDEDEALQGRYFTRVPVVTVDGREVFEAKMMDAGGIWRRALSEALA